MSAAIEALGGTPRHSHPTRSVTAVNPFIDTTQCCGLVNSVTRSTPTAINLDNSKTRLRSPTFIASNIIERHSSAHADTSPGMSVPERKLHDHSQRPGVSQYPELRLATCATCARNLSTSASILVWWRLCGLGSQTFHLCFGLCNCLDVRGLLELCLSRLPNFLISSCQSFFARSQEGFGLQRSLKHIHFFGIVVRELRWKPGSRDLRDCGRLVHLRRAAGKWCGVLTWKTLA